jgi:hypothetical protein
LVGKTARLVGARKEGLKMAGNLPDGVTTSMIPGCRPEDEEFDRQLEDLENEVQSLFTQYWDAVVDEFIRHFLECEGRL